MSEECNNCLKHLYLWSLLSNINIKALLLLLLLQNCYIWDGHHLVTCSVIINKKPDASAGQGLSDDVLSSSGTDEAGDKQHVKNAFKMIGNQFDKLDGSQHKFMSLESFGGRHDDSNMKTRKQFRQEKSSEKSERTFLNNAVIYNNILNGRFKRQILPNYNTTQQNQSQHNVSNENNPNSKQRPEKANTSNEKNTSSILNTTESGAQDTTDHVINRIINDNVNNEKNDSGSKNNDKTVASGSILSNEIPIDLKLTTLRLNIDATTVATQIDQCKSSVCKCSNSTSKLTQLVLKTVDCSDLGLHVVTPNDIPLWTERLKLTNNRLDSEKLPELRNCENLRELYLEENHIYTLQSWAPLSKSLTHLSLARNLIDYFGNRTFSGLDNLLYLNAGKNKIELIHQNALFGLSKLEVLILNDNRISELDVTWFRKLENLKELHLANNNIHTLDNGSLRYLSSLTKLDLQANHLHIIYQQAFVGLRQLKELYLQQNSLYQIPSAALQQLYNCSHIVDMSSNYFKAIEPYSVSSVNVTSLKIASIIGLKMIDSHSFVNLAFLQHLQMTDNKELVYIDRSAFVNTPLLKQLTLSGNALTTLEKEIVLSMFSLSSSFIPSTVLNTKQVDSSTAAATSSYMKEIDLSSNPLFCDCALMWVSDTSFLKKNNVTLKNFNITHCHFPANMTGLLVKDMKLKPSLVKAYEDGCAPRIISSLINTRYNASLGDSLDISCKATGIPLPIVKWYFPLEHKRKLDKLALRRGNNVRHGDNPTNDQLSIDFAEKEDGGSYTCEAKNTHGVVTKNLFLFIKMSSAYLILSKLTSTSVTMTWGNTQHAKDYEIFYHPGILSTNFTYRIVKIEPYMREYTLSGLLPNTKYHICISVNNMGKHIPINCTDIHTRDIDFVEGALRSSKNVVIFGAISILLAAVIVICLVGYCSRKYNKKKEREQKLYTDSLSQLYPASLDSISDTTPITYENKIAEMYDLDQDDFENQFIGVSTDFTAGGEVEEGGDLEIAESSLQHSQQEPEELTTST